MFKYLKQLINHQTPYDNDNLSPMKYIRKQVIIYFIGIFLIGFISGLISYSIYLFLSGYYLFYEFF